MRPATLAIAVAAVAAAATAVVCPDVDVRNEPANLERLRNCTEIVGFLRILLIEKVRDEHEFDDYVFPRLTKISGFLLFYKVYHLTSIGKIFPNLSIIRGVKTLTDYALIIYEMPHLKEIATPNLRFISRGYVKVDKCPKICFVDTVNWSLLGPTGSTVVNYRNVNNGTCPACPRICNGYCWNSEHCQDLDTPNCHKECLGCEKPNDPSACLACKNFDSGGTCVSECPEKRYKHLDSARCLSAEECNRFSNSTPWWPFNDSCVSECPADYKSVKVGGRYTCEHCGEKCVFSCKNIDREEKDGYHFNVIDTMEELKRFERCTHIEGHLTIRFSGLDPYREKNLVSELKHYLGHIRSISQNLVIGRTNYIKEIDFLPRLRVIEGNDKQYAIFFYENKNLQKLWDWSKFNLQINKGSIAFHDNPQLCLSEIKTLANLTNVNYTDNDVSKYSNGDKSSCNVANLEVKIVDRNETNVTFAWTPPPLDDVDDTYLGFTIFYTDRATDGNVSTFESDDVCDNKGWNTNFTTNTTMQLVGLRPFTRYAYFIKSYMRMGGSQTPVDYFHTLAGDPEGPDLIQVKALSHKAILLNWETPRQINGILDHYTIFVVLEKDREEFVRQRNYCLQPRSRDGDKTDYDKVDEEIVTTTERFTNTTILTQTCDCSPPDRFLEHRFFQTDNVMSLCDIDAQSKFGYDQCKSYSYNISIKDSPEFLKVHKRNYRKMIARNESVPYPNLRYFEIPKIPANATTYVVEPLRHYSLYVFYISVCNLPREDGKELCSYIIESYARTLKDDNADDVAKPLVVIEKNSVVVTWVEPEHPNSLILAYRVEYTKLDKEHVTPNVDCIQEDRVSRRKRHVLKNLLPGDYRLTVRAESLAGLGNPSPEVEFYIDAPTTRVGLIVSSVVFCVTAFIAAITFYFWYKYKKRQDNIRLITSINPDYAPTYIEDEWEVDRMDIELQNELGQGIFGSVHYGILKPRNLPVAVKTCHTTSSAHDQMEFLNEASVMKSFNKAHHVVKLLGVVSKGAPPLVIMELMERGDLKKYLRKMRDSSQNITCNEIYRMSIEIADGMAYLAAKKFVHRDLAARNCMVGQDRTVKIGDFGMARDVYETDYYKKGTKGLLPVRWMAPESLADGVFTSDTDVWSYGIILWEIATLAEQPYQGLANEQVLQFVTSRGRLERPPECPDLLYEIMRACWNWRPIERPTFNDIVDKLEDHVGQDFQLVSFYHSREGRESRLLARERAINQPALGAEGIRDYYTVYNVSDDEVSLQVDNSNGRSYLGTSRERRRFSPEF